MTKVLRLLLSTRRWLHSARLTAAQVFLLAVAVLSLTFVAQMTLVYVRVVAGGEFRFTFFSSALTALMMMELGIAVFATYAFFALRHNYSGGAGGSGMSTCPTNGQSGLHGSRSVGYHNRFESAFALITLMEVFFARQRVGRPQQGLSGRVFAG